MSNSQPQVSTETATRLSYFGPSVKREVDELAALGGMTRLVPRKSSSTPSTPSYSASSPSSQPPTSTPPPPDSTYHPVADTPSSWHEYTHVQDFNTFSSYPAVPGPLRNDISLRYANSESSMGLDALPEYHAGYEVPSLRGTFGQFPQVMQGGGDIITSTADPHASWQNFMAQFKPV